ncbi:phage tail protein [Flavobacterium chungangense]|uniref:Phage tail protein n=1 Tax=Flavobacterium chungangense TaxID=554283 RepID=A0A6V6Z2B5_9FLAO|nr:tail fiber protein [Flavobacterium chungangense]CAD0005938.1 phage tail protein [Flavobacterium chungangense]
MAEPFLAETRIMSFNFAPKGWAMCNGQFLPINQNQALFSLLGTSFGGNGQTTFALPDLRGRTPIHFGNNFMLGQRGGEEAHTLTINELPAHQHNLNNTNQAVSTNVPNSGTSMLGNTAPNQVYNTAGQNLAAMNPASVSNVGGSQPHLNMQPFLTLNFCIALQGIFPSQN